MLETVAAVPGMVGGALQHLRALRRLESDRGWIRTLLDEAENERMHLMTFIQIARPSTAERLLILLAQGVFYNLHLHGFGEPLLDKLLPDKIRLAKKYRITHTYIVSNACMSCDWVRRR